jgi:ferrous iron transport protein A
VPHTHQATTLGSAPLRFRGRISRLDASACGSGLPAAELEHRLLELGFVEGATVEIRHQGLFRADPIAVRVNGATIALRRREARAIQIVAAGEPS